MSIIIIIICVRAVDWKAVIRRTIISVDRNIIDQAENRTFHYANDIQLDSTTMAYCVLFYSKQHHRLTIKIMLTIYYPAASTSIPPLLSVPLEQRLKIHEQVFYPVKRVSLTFIKSFTRFVITLHNSPPNYTPIIMMGEQAALSTYNYIIAQVLLQELIKNLRLCGSGKVLHSSYHAAI